MWYLRTHRHAVDLCLPSRFFACLPWVRLGRRDGTTGVAMAIAFFGVLWPLISDLLLFKSYFYIGILYNMFRKPL